MAELLRYDGRFELGRGSGKYVYVQTEEYKQYGRRLIADIKARWTPPIYYFHLREGGHVEAARCHQSSKWFAHLDLKRFFNSCKRSRVVRALSNIGYMRTEALQISSDSLVKLGRARVIPYGFSQSPLLATLCLHFSELGNEIGRIHEQGGLISVYVDDLIVSGPTQQIVDQLVDRLVKAAHSANFDLAHEKTSGTQPHISPFNLALSHKELELGPEQYAEFEKRLETCTNEYVREGTLRYARFVNKDQAETLGSV